MPDRTEALLRQLARELSPVRRLPRLRTAGLALAGAFALGLALQAGLAGPLRVAGVPWGEVPFRLLLVALVVGGSGAVLAALAGAVPGRESAARLGRWLAGAGLAMGLLGALLGWGHPVDAAVPVAAGLRCAFRACLLGLVPAALVAGFLARALVRHPRRGAGLAFAGVVALGAAAVHASCGVGGAPHALLGHVAAPLAAGLLLSLPLAARLSRLPRLS